MIDALFVVIADPKALRLQHDLCQNRFWRGVGVSQSSGSRYEFGNACPPAVTAMLHLVYLPQPDAAIPAAYRKTDGGMLPMLFAPIPDVLAIRRQTGLTQYDFWRPLHTTDAAGCRYEKGRAMSKAISALVRLVYIDRALPPST